MKDGAPSDVNTKDYFAGRKVALFALPGAFTPTCSVCILRSFKVALRSFKVAGNTAATELTSHSLLYKNRELAVDTTGRGTCHCHGPILVVRQPAFVVEAVVVKCSLFTLQPCPVLDEGRCLVAIISATWISLCPNIDPSGVTLQKQHLPGFVQKAGEFKTKGIDEIACLSVNDVFVMDAWGKDQNADGKV